MTFDRNTRRKIAQLKLKEIRLQRDQLAERYDRILASAEASAAPLERLRLIYEGLKGTRLVGRPLHEALNDLEVLLKALPHRPRHGEIARRWEARLRDELERGRFRSEVIYTFGALLEEWVAHPAPEAPPPSEAALAALLEPRPEVSTGARAALLDALLREACFGGLKAAIAPIALYDLGRVDRISEHLGLIAQDPERAEWLRAEARAFDRDQAATKALADAVSLIGDDLESWRWPEEGVAVRGVRTTERIRLHPECDLITTLLLQRAGEVLFSPLRSGLYADPSRLMRWPSTRAERLIGPLNDPSLLRASKESSSITLHRDRARRGAFEVGLRGGVYDGDGGAMEQLIRLVHAEVQLHLEARDGPLFITRTDLSSFFHSIDHALIHALLERLEAPAKLRRFISAYLAMGIQRGEEIARPGRGIPLGFQLSRLLAELVMTLLEVHVRRVEGVRVIRLVDDVALLATDAAAAEAGWAALLEATEALGLSINTHKTGSIAARWAGALPEGLPRGPVRWGLLQLTETGAWGVHPESLEALIERARLKIEAATSALGKIAAYNAEARHLVHQLSPASWLGEAHREASFTAAARLREALLGEGGPMMRLLGRISEHFARTQARGLPEGWLAWPLSAGGLGFVDPMISLAMYPRRALKPPKPPRREGFELDDAEWGDWYWGLLQPLLPTLPEDDPVQRSLKSDFIKRGGEVRGGHQAQLKPYWQWVLATYGPEIIERLGTYRFLITELVPLDVIREVQGLDAELDGRARVVAWEDDIPF